MWADYSVLLIYPPTGPVIAEPPYSVMYLARALEKRGINPVIVDGRFDDVREVCRETLKKSRILLAGISAMTGPQIIYGLRCARRLRKWDPALPIVWGGIHPTIETASTLENPLVDVIIRAAGEKALPDLAERLKGRLEGNCRDRLGSLRKTVISAESTDISQSFPMPWDMVKAERYVDYTSLSVPAFYLITSRGCRYRCSFCYSWEMHDCWEALPVEAIFREVDIIVKKMPWIRAIIFHDDNFSCDRERLIKVCEGMADRKLHYVLASHPGDIDVEAIRLHARCGCLRLDFAVESGSDRILKQLGKGIDSPTALKAAELCGEYGVPCYISFMAGHPAETLGDLRETLNFMDRIRRISPIVSISDLKIFTPYPGTPDFNKAMALGFRPPERLQDWGRMYWNQANLPWAPGNKLLDRISFTSLLAFCDHRISAGTGISKGRLRPFTAYARKKWLKRQFDNPLIKAGSMLLSHTVKSGISNAFFHPPGQG